LGRELLVAPLWSDTTFERQIYLPKGRWIDFWDDTVYQGSQTITYTAPIDKAPILVKAGAIIPMAPDNQLYIDQKKSPLTIRFYPEGTSAFTLYEDDGVSYDYQKGVYALTTFRCSESDSGILITKSAPKGLYKLSERDHIFEVHKQKAVKSVTKADKKLPQFGKRAQFDSEGEGWFYDPAKKIVWAKIKGGAHEPASLKFFKTVPTQ
jgi:alpha-glucosidase (family GH31 glycosyl hydrolase)